MEEIIVTDGNPDGAPHLLRGLMGAGFNSAMAAGITDHVWSVEDIVKLLQPDS